MECPECNSSYPPDITGGACPFCGYEPPEIDAETARVDIQNVESDDFPRKKTIRDGTHAGKKYRVCRVALTPLYGWSHYTAYVETDLADAYDWDELNRGLRAHGGITYAEGTEVGFDTGHALDVNVDVDGDPLPGDINSRMGFGNSDILSRKKWSPDHVEAEVRRLCEEVARAEQEVAANQKASEPPEGSKSEPKNDTQ